MRIISQDRKTDVPYESYVIRVADEHIIAQADPRDYGYVLAAPETWTEAKMAMDKIRESYIDGAKVIYMDYIMEEVKEEC